MVDDGDVSVKLSFLADTRATGSVAKLSAVWGLTSSSGLPILAHGNRD